jgi:3-carboxy-cis,cis-muconate cycloisomerase
VNPSVRNGPVHRARSPGGRASQPFQPLIAMFGDATMAAIFSERASIEAWLQVERALAGAQGRIGVIPTSAATAIESAARVDRINIVALRRAARNVGYPILPLLDQIAKGAPEDVAGFLHWGATTQDIMDTGLALQMTRGINRCGALLIALGDDLAAVLAAHESTLVAARTHGQHAVPTTFGAKVAVWLSELVPPAPNTGRSRASGRRPTLRRGRDKRGDGRSRARCTTRGGARVGSGRQGCPLAYRERWAG